MALVRLGPADRFRAVAHPLLQPAQADGDLCLRARADPRALGVDHGRPRIAPQGLGARRSVTLDKTNFVIALAPYFFPLYTILVIIGFYALALFFDLHTYEPFWLGLIGLTWCFHLTFTIRTLLQHQPDIHQHGRVFSYSIIYLANVLGVALWIVLIASPSLQTLAQVLGRETVDAYLACRDAGLMIWEKVGTALQAVC